MFITHKSFLKYLIYLLVVVLLFGASYSHGLLQLAFNYDKSYFSIATTIFYILSEGYLSILVWQLSTDILQSNRVLYKLKSNFEIEPKLHQSSAYQFLLRKKESGLSSTDIISSIEDKLYHKYSYPSFMGQALVWIGLIGTIIGIIITFYPFMTMNDAALASDIQQNLITVFSGIGSAFFPSLFASIFTIFSIYVDNLFSSSISELKSIVENVDSAGDEI